MTEKVEGELYHHISRYSFDGPQQQQYLVLIEHYPDSLFAIKFYLKAHQGSNRRFHLLTGFGKAPRIIRTCIEIMLTLLKENPSASFCILGTSLENESPEQTKRYRIYRNVLQNFFSPVRFEHRHISGKSLYLLINKNNNVSAIINRIGTLIQQYHWD